MGKIINKQQIGKISVFQLNKIEADKTNELTTKIGMIASLILRILTSLTEVDNLYFTSQLSRLAYMFQVNELDTRTQYYIQLILISSKHANRGHPDSDIFDTGVLIVKELISSLCDFEIINGDKSVKWPIDYKEVKYKGGMDYAKLVIGKIDSERKEIIGYDFDNLQNKITVKYGEIGQDSYIKDTVKQILSLDNQNYVIGLLEVSINEDGYWIPKGVVLEPDFLMDVSTISECFQYGSSYPVLYLLRKYLPFNSSVHSMIGNIANYFLDELMNNPNAKYSDIMPSSFKINPLVFATMDDSKMRVISKAMQKHWLHLKKLVNEEMKSHEISPNECYLEPSFYSNRYGLQGRLDVFYKKENDSAIIELKSGKVFKPNNYQIVQSHFVQTLLYDLLVRSVYLNEVNPRTFIFYSQQDRNRLRFTPRIKQLQMEAIGVRNMLVTIELNMALVEENGRNYEGKWISFLDKIKPKFYPKLKGYLFDNLEKFEKVYGALDEIEKQYINVMSGFIAREYRLSKVGISTVDNPGGLARLWLNNMKEKQERYELLKGLKIISQTVQSDNPIVILSKELSQNDQIANFRKGDIVILYPSPNGNNNVLDTQIFKGTIIKLKGFNIHVKLRYKQFNNRVFLEEVDWSIEPDSLDIGLNNFYQGLFTWSEANVENRKLLLSRKAPCLPGEVGYHLEATKSYLSNDQNRILQKFLISKDYFLLWGPPGTGKTSRMLKAMVDHLINNSSESILILAYTNRAVDEMCEAINQIRNILDHGILRLGNKHSTHPDFIHWLLSSKLSNIKTRKTLRTLIISSRIVISTVAKIGSKKELLKIKKFDRVIIDEASQILEPSLIGILSSFNHFTLIGDHKQLPAVVAQDSQKSKIKETKLQKETGLINCNNSLFERLYNNCINNEWHWAFDQLSEQGRMHNLIMKFSSQHYYNNTLKTLPEIIPHSKNQHVKLIERYRNNGKKTTISKAIRHFRWILIDTTAEKSLISNKTDLTEANLTVNTIQSIEALYKQNDLRFDLNSLGVITPYRAQIALIKSLLEQKDQNLYDKVTIDTVERFQGGARSIIIYSLVANSEYQMENIMNLDSEGIDRKLNVAMTRAKEQIIIIGNKQVMLESQSYAPLVSFIDKYGMVIQHPEPNKSTTRPY